MIFVVALLDFWGAPGGEGPGGPAKFSFGNILKDLAYIFLFECDIGQFQSG